MSRFKWKPIISAGLKCAFSALLLILLIYSLPENVDWRRFQSAAWIWLSAAAAAGILQFVILALRWRQTTLTWLGEDPPVFDGSRYAFISMLWISAAISQILPGLVAGDGYRVAALRSRGLTFKSAMASVVSDRVIGMAALALLSVPGAALLFGKLWPVLWLLLPVGSAACVFWLIWRRRTAIRDRLPGSVVQFLHMFARRFASLRGILLLGMAVAGHALSVLIFYSAARALALDLPLVPLILVFPLALFAAMLPVSAGGWGVREFTLVSGLAAFGAKASDVLLASVFFGILNVLLAAASALFIVASLVKAKGSRT